MGLVFVNYRTADTGYGAAEVAAALVDTVGRDQVFLDRDSMLPGTDYPHELRDAVERCDVLVAVVGPGWLGRDEHGVRFVDRDRDWVREEIALALARGVPVVPVLLRGALMPAAAELPEEIARFAHCQAFELPLADLGGGLRRLRAALVGKAPVLLVPEVFEADQVLPDDHLPSALLRPEFEVVPFEHREDELRRLRTWVHAEDKASALLVTGAGGQGKTRLARRLCTELDWVTGFLRENVPEDTLAAVCALEVPMLLVVDYAEGRTDQVIAAMTAFAGRRDAPGRLLLLGRSAGEWRHKLKKVKDEAAAARLADCAELALPPLVTSADREAEFGRALHAFARRRGRDPAGVARLDLDHPRYDNVLDIHAAALAVLLDDLIGEVGEWRDPVARLLQHERDHWRRSAGAYRLPKDDDDPRFAQVVAAATMFGGAERQAALRLLGALPALDGELPRLVAAYLAWCRDLYPGTGTLNGLRPDRLGEDHVAATMEFCPELATALIDVASPDQARHALVVLGRAAPRHDAAADALKRLFRHDPDRLAIVGVEVATETADPGPIADTLTRLVEDATGATFLRRLAAGFPLDTIALVELGVLVTRKALAAENDPGSAEHARLLSSLGNRLLQLDEVDDALAYLIEAADVYESLAADGDNAATAAWAESLSDLGDALNLLGQHEDAVMRTAQAVDLLRTLGSEHGDTLVETLIDHAANLIALDRDDEAAQILADTVREAERIGPELLAHALHHQGDALAQLGRLSEACAATERAADLYKQLAADAPDRYADTFAEVMADLSGLRHDVGRAAEALAASEEAVTTVEALARTYGRRFDHALANALNNHGIVLADHDRHDEAEQVIRDALRLFRSLATARSEVYQTHIGKALGNLANSLRALDRLHEALDADTESVTIFRKLAGPAPEEPDPDLIEALLRLYLDLAELGRLADGHDAVLEAVRLSRRLVADNPDLGVPKLAAALGNLAESRKEIGQVRRAIAPADESLRLHRDLACELPARYLAGQAHMAQLLGILLSLQGKHRKALHAHTEALGLYRALDGDPCRHRRRPA